MDYSILTIPPPLAALQRRLAGLTLYAVGGAVRDALLGRGDGSGDDDIAGPHTPDEVVAACERGGVEIAAKTPKLGTLILRMELDGAQHSFEYTAFRIESYDKGHRPDNVTFTRSMALDAARRDFTVNALYMDLSTGKVSDPTGMGLEDLALKRLRAVSKSTMLDDGLRILRLVRFACELGFTIEPETYRLAKAHAHKLSEIAPERINAELSRILLSDLAERPQRFSTPPHVRGLLALKDLGALGVIEPALANLPVCRGELCSPAITTNVGRWPAGEHSSPLQCGIDGQGILAVRMAALLARVGPERADAALLNLRYPNAVRQTVNAILEARSNRDTPRFILAELGRKRARLFVALMYELGDDRTGAFAAALYEMERLGAPFSAGELAIGGGDICAALGIAPSPRVGEIMRGLWRRCVLEPGLNEKDKLLEILGQL